MRAIIIGLILLLSVSIANAAQYVTLLDGATTTGVSQESSVSSRAERTYWIFITGTATLSIQMSPKAGADFIDLVNNISTSTIVDTVAPGTRTRINVSTCTACTVSVVLELR